MYKLRDYKNLWSALEMINDIGIRSPYTHAFSCCQSCGKAEMETWEKEELEDNHSYVGYTFYHDQDLEGFKETGELALSYDYFDNSEKTENSHNTEKIGHLISEFLKAYELNVIWNGSADKRIIVKV